MLTRTLLYTLRPISASQRLAKSALPSARSARSLSITTLRNSDERPKAVRPDSHAEVAVSGGEHVADHAAQDEKTMSGLPKAEEKDLGMSIHVVMSEYRC